LKGDNICALESADPALSLDVSYHRAIDTRGQILVALGRQNEAYEQFICTVDLGDETYVRKVEEALKGHGYDPGPVDGMPDTETKAALRACIQNGCRLLE